MQKNIYNSPTIARMQEYERNLLDPHNKEGLKLRKQLLQYKRGLVADLLKWCSPGQLRVFNAMYKSVNELPADKIEWAIVQLENTIKSNKRYVRMGA